MYIASPGEIIDFTVVFSLEVEALRAEISERSSQIQWLQERLIETETQKQEAIAAIAQASRMLHIQKHSTIAEVFKLKGESMPL
jgi:kinetochore protein Spc7/SPC105